MCRPELKHDKKISRLSAAKTILNNVEDYTGMGAAYGDSQRFRYSATHFCSFLLLSNYLCVNDIWTCFFLGLLKTVLSPVITALKTRTIPALFLFGVVCQRSSQQFLELMVG